MACGPSASSRAPIRTIARRRRSTLDAALAQQLADFMPGMADGLHEHEWREHGGCSGLDDDDYFRRTLELARAFDAALGARLTTLAGRETSAAELRETAEMFQPGIGATLTFHCRTLRGARATCRMLIEVRQCVDNDGPDGAPGTLLDCATVKRRDQGCGRLFLIAAARDEPAGARNCSSPMYSAPTRCSSGCC